MFDVVPGAAVGEVCIMINFKISILYVKTRIQVSEVKKLNMES